MAGRMYGANAGDRKLRILRGTQARLKLDPWQLSMPVSKAYIWAEVVPSTRVRRLEDSCSIYTITCEESGGSLSDVIITLYKSDLRQNGRRLILRERVDCCTNEYRSLRHGLLVLVDELQDRVSVLYTRHQKPRAQWDARQLKQPSQLFLQTFTMAVGQVQVGEGVDEVNAMQLTGLPSQVVDAGLVRFPPPAKGHIELCDAVLHPDYLLVACRLYDITACSTMDYLLKLDPRAPAKQRLTTVQAKGSDYQHYLGCVLEGFTYEDERILLRGPIVHEELVAIPWLISPVSLRETDVEACTIFGQVNSEYKQECIKPLLAYTGEDGPWQCLGEVRRWLLMVNRRGNGTVYALRGWEAGNPHTVVVRSLDVQSAVVSWMDEEVFARLGANAGKPQVHMNPWALHGSQLLLHIRLTPTTQVVGKGKKAKKQEEMPKDLLKRIDLDEWLPLATLCSACRSTELPIPPKKPQACKQCKEKGFDGYWWLFGSRFCNADCLQEAWPTHRRLHKMPHLDQWQLADWKRWKTDFKPNLDKL